MQKVYNSFEFIGRISLPKETDKFKVYKKDEFSSKWVKESLKLNVKANDSSELVTIEDGYYNKPGYSFEKNGIGKKNEDGSFSKGDKISIAWKDRLNKTVIDKVANNQKFILDLSNNKERYDLRVAIEKLEKNDLLEEEKQDLIDKYETDDIDKLKEKLKEKELLKHEFLSRVDMIKEVKDLVNTSEGTNTIFKISGNIALNEWKGKIYRNFEVKRIEKATDKDKIGLKGNFDIYFNSESLDETLFEDTKKYVVSAWTKSYDSQLKQDIFLPITLIADGSKLDLENEKHVRRLKGLIKPFKDKDDDIIYQTSFEVKFANGSERIEITMDDLEDVYKEYIEDGIMTFEEVKRELGGDKFGDRVKETRLFKPSNLKLFPNGSLETDLSLSDMFTNKEDLSDNTDSSKDNYNEQEEEEDDIDDLL